MNLLDSFLSLRKGNKSTIFWFWLTSFAPFLFIYLHIFAILWTCEGNVSVWLISNLLICCFHFYSSPNGTGSFCRQFCFMCLVYFKDSFGWEKLDRFGRKSNILLYDVVWQTYWKCPMQNLSSIPLNCNGQIEWIIHEYHQNVRVEREET